MVVGPEPAADPKEARRLRRITEAYLGHLYGPRHEGHWYLRQDGEATHRIALLSAWVRPQAESTELWVAVGATHVEPAIRIVPGLLQLLVLGFDAQGRIVERSRSPWMREGTYGGPPNVQGLLKVGANRWAFVTYSGEISQGYGVTVYTLRAPKGPGFQRLGQIFHHDVQGHREPLWSETLELQARPSAEEAACWPLVALRERWRTFARTDRVVFRRERAIPCRANSTYGVIGINHNPWW